MKCELKMYTERWERFQRAVEVKQTGEGRDLYPDRTITECEKKAENTLQEIERIENLVEEQESLAEQNAVEELPFICPDCHYRTGLVVTVLDQDERQLNCEECGFQKTYEVTNGD